MKLKAKSIAVLLLATHLLVAQEVEVRRTRTFTASGLYGFMNGGADQFLEYGVRKLLVEEITYQGEEYSVEVYEMPSPEDAFGIYSLHTFRCLRRDTLGCIDCLSPYQLQAVSGNHYVSVVFPSGSLSAKEKVDEVIRKYVPMNMETNPFLPDLLEIDLPVSGRLKYLRGPLSATSVSLSFSKVVEDISYKGIWFLSEPSSKAYRALIIVNENEDIETIKKRLSSTHILGVGTGFVYLSGMDGD